MMKVPYVVYDNAVILGPRIHSVHPKSRTKMAPFPMMGLESSLHAVFSFGGSAAGMSWAINAMESHDWPGNVRELKNRVRRALVMAAGRLITSCGSRPGAPYDTARPGAVGRCT